MTENDDLLTNLVQTTGKRVMIGNGKKVRVQGVGSIKHPEQPSLINVYLVERLKSNLISIS